MKTNDSPKNTLLALKKNFNFKDFFGFSSLVLGLMLSSNSLNKTNTIQVENKSTESHVNTKSESKINSKNSQYNKKNLKHRKTSSVL
jgi:hypothetical protein